MNIRGADSLIRGSERRAHALAIVRAGISAVLPENVVRNAVKLKGNRLQVGSREYDLEQYDHIYVAGGGKAAATMAAELENLLGDRITAGLVNDRYGVQARTTRTRVNNAGHPLPTEDGQRGVREMLDMLSGASKDDLVIFLISGGGSALLPCPAPGISLEDKIRLTDLLLKSGATIAEINCVRKHSSCIKGGQLLRYVNGATVLSLIVSDVVGDDPGSIASGPTAPDNTTFADALSILDNYGLKDLAPVSILRHLEAGMRGQVPETLKPGDPAFGRVYNEIIAGNLVALKAAAGEAQRLGYHPIILGSHIKGESREVGLVHAGIAKECLTSGNPAPLPAAIISGGETTVTVRGPGKGGRNEEFILGVLRDYTPGITAVSADTDGIDGATDACGAIADETTLPRAESLGLSIQKALDSNASYDFFEALGDLIFTGPTGTNVSDLRVVLVYKFQ
ncbi:glycerate kinase type-2 family protein [Methanocella arvoryzae]|nr:glycerate kinase [Methanocella arvoryzae]